ncbi:hypothetical protein [Mesorhizobium sp. M7A.F.Ca.ET.027.03.2.1]|uniref:hypothetical protein n=1 Tax=Mesorhizobium sp. M7A.F.Ca.ET.027.03.2.1 TaxID=2496656 RepID=UPI000FCC1405|nr:hypothetical protein [Mesorhizobium sp. M7A.F.Ca.ET.027.03.2.1]RVD54216.1 hypothetical protein EN750_25815 [Mesorhizobium sp. M7A.F.Ca.ET.027.03.2.1]
MAGKSRIFLSIPAFFLMFTPHAYADRSDPVFGDTRCQAILSGEGGWMTNREIDICSGRDPGPLRKPIKPAQTSDVELPTLKGTKKGPTGSVNDVPRKPGTFTTPTKKRPPKKGNGSGKGVR